MARLTTTDEYVVVRIDDDTFGIAATTKSRHGITIVERPLILQNGDSLDAITIAKALNKSLAEKKSDRERR